MSKTAENRCEWREGSWSTGSLPLLKDAFSPGRELVVQRAGQQSQSGNELRALQNASRGSSTGSDSTVKRVRLLGHAAIIAVIAAAGLFVASLRLPVWHLKMEAPQYQGNEALHVQVYPGTMRGDLREIRVLNQYIGVHIPERLPQLRWVPICLLAAAGLGLAALWLPRRFRSQALWTIAGLASVAMLVAAGTAQWQMHRIGHERDPHAALKGVPNFTPPLLGRVKIANFEITTGLGFGAGLIAAGIALQILAGLTVCSGSKSKVKVAPSSETNLQLSTFNRQPGLAGRAPTPE